MVALDCPHTVLLAEDEIFIRELYDRVLTQAGFTVLSASDGEQALELVKKKPDLILLDVMMPKLNGIEVLKKLKSNPETKKIPVVLITNLGTEKVIKEAFDIGAQGYIMKMRNDPYDIVRHVKEFCANPDYKMDINDFDLG